jgi:hypothetical protein
LRKFNAENFLIGMEFWRLQWSGSVSWMREARKEYKILEEGAVGKRRKW